MTCGWRRWRRSTSCPCPSGWPANAAMACSSGSGLRTWAKAEGTCAGRLPGPQNHSELTIARPWLARCRLYGCWCSSTWVSLSRLRHRRPVSPPGRWSNRSSPSTLSISANTGNSSPAGSCRYQRSGVGALSAMPCSANTGAMAWISCCTWPASSASAGPWASMRTPCMSAATKAGSARNQRPSPASPASNWRVNAATGHSVSAASSCGKCRDNC